MEKKYVKTNYTGCSYITAGKLYEIIDDGGGWYDIIDDVGARITIVTKELGASGHLHHKGTFEWATPEQPKEEKIEQEYKTFGELSKEEKLALFEAWLEGAQIQIYNTEDECFVDIVYAIWSEGVCYRIKPDLGEMPSIDWSHVHPDYKWLAVGNSGKVFLYKEKPEVAGNYWSTDTEYAEACAFASYKRGNAAWDKSLVKRPEGV